MIRRTNLIATLLLLAFALAGCGKKDAGDEEKGGELVPDVTVAKVVRGPIADNLIVNGNLAGLPNKDAKVAALVPGRIARVLVVEGDRVRPGQPLAELDSTLLREQERQSAAQVKQAQATVENAKLAAQREETLLQRGVSSRKEVEDARTQLAVAQATLQQQESALATSRAQVSRSIVRAPFDGTVVKRFVAAGEQVDGSAAQPVVEVADIDTLELLGTVPASRLQDIRIGNAFKFQTNAAEGTVFTAKVVSVLPAVDPATNNGTVRIRIDNAKHQLKLGQYLSVDLPLKQAGTTLIVPRQAIYPDESGEPRVYKVTGEDASQVPVQLGVQTKDKAEIVSGVQEGDTVIVTGGYGLPEKSKVHIKQ